MTREPGGRPTDPRGPDCDYDVQPARFRLAREVLRRHGVTADVHAAVAARFVADGSLPVLYRTGAYQAWRTHVGTLLADAGLGGRAALPDALLAPLAPDVFAHQRASGRTAGEIAADLGLLARSLLQQ
jgi:hypothetical protein